MAADKTLTPAERDFIRVEASKVERFEESQRIYWGLVSYFSAQSKLYPASTPTFFDEYGVESICRRVISKEREYTKKAHDQSWIIPVCVFVSLVVSAVVSVVIMGPK